MASRAENLDAIIDQTVARIKEVTASQNPDYSVAGRSISKGAYLATLTDQLFKLEQARQRADGPFEVRTVGHT